MILDKTMDNMTESQVHPRNFSSMVASQSIHQGVVAQDLLKLCILLRYLFFLISYLRPCGTSALMQYSRMTGVSRGLSAKQVQ